MGKTSSSSSRAAGLQRVGGRIQRASTHSLPSTAASAPSGARATKKWVSKRTLTWAGVIQRE